VVQYSGDDIGIGCEVFVLRSGSDGVLLEYNMPSCVHFRINPLLSRKVMVAHP